LLVSGGRNGRSRDTDRVVSAHDKELSVRGDMLFCVFTSSATRWLCIPSFRFGYIIDVSLSQSGCSDHKD